MPGKHVSASPRRERRRGPQHERLLVGGGSPRGLPDDSGRSWGSEDAVLGAYGPAALPQERTQCARGPVLRGPRGWLTRREPTAVEGAFGSVALKPGRFCRLRQNSGARARAEDGAVGAQGVASPPGPRLSQAAGAGCATPRERGRGEVDVPPSPVSVVWPPHSLWLRAATRHQEPVEAPGDPHGPAQAPCRRRPSPPRLRAGPSQSHRARLAERG